MVRLLRRLFDKSYEIMERRDFLKPFKPLLDATDAFFFGKPDVTAAAPHIRDRLDVKRYMTVVVVGLMPATLASIYFFGWRVVIIILVSYICGGITEVVFSIIRKEEITEGFLVTGLLFPLTLPPTIPLWIVAVGVVVGVILGKEIFGGTGKNFFNPALVGRCFIAICFPVQMTQPQVWHQNVAGGAGGFAVWQTPAIEEDALTSATPLMARKNVLAGKIAEERLPSYRGLFLGTTRGSIGETSAFLLILGGLLIIFAKIASWRIVFSCIFFGGALSWLMNTIGFEKFAPPFFTLFAGGYMLGAFFMATDPVSAPTDKTARWIYGGLIGIITVIIRSISGYVEGMMFAILLMNVFAPLLDEIMIGRRYRGVKV